MRLNHLLAIAALVSGCMLVGCHSDVDLSNVNTTSQVQMGLAVPVGSINVKLGDFLGSGEVKQIVVDKWGTFHFMDTVNIPTKNYHNINVADYIIKNDATLHFNLKDKASVIPGGTTIPFKFDLELGLEGINNDKTQERIDSIWVKEAKFTSQVDRHHLNVNWSDIQSVQLVLGDQFRRPNGPVIDIPIEGKGFGQEMEINVRNFTLNLLNDPADPSKGTVDKIKFSIIFKVRTDSDVPIYDDSRFGYNMKVKVIDYDAIWGFFEASNEMRDENTLVMDSVWDGWKDLKNLELRIAEPKIDVFVTHKIAAPLEMTIEYLRAAPKGGEPVYAQWKEGAITNTYKVFQFGQGEVLSPLLTESTLDQSITLQRSFSQEEGYGQIDRLFEVRPDTFSYSFFLRVNPKPNTYYWNYTQHRITKDAKVTGFAAIDVPFAFKENSKLTYSMIIDSVAFLNKMALDSVYASVKVLDSIGASNVKLHVQVENTIPFNIDAHLVFVDSLGKDMDDLDQLIHMIDPKQETDSAHNHLFIKAPEMSTPTGPKDFDNVEKASVSKFVFEVETKNFERLNEVKQIRLDAAIMDNPQPCALMSNSGLKVRIAVSAQADVFLNFNDNK